MTTKQRMRRFVLISIAWLLFAAGSVMYSMHYYIASILLVMGSSMVQCINEIIVIGIVKELEACKWCDSGVSTISVKLIKRDANGDNQKV